MVQLIREIDKQFARNYYRFNTNMVQLIPARNSGVLIDNQGFNTNMVQLIPVKIVKKNRECLTSMQFLPCRDAVKSRRPPLVHFPLETDDFITP